jgi:plastocyanin
MTTQDENPIIKTTTRRMAKGLAIIVIMMAVGAAIGVPNWHNFAKNPPPVSSITTKAASAGGGASSTAGSGGAATQSATPAAVPAGATSITILAGASTQGNPNYDPAAGKVPLGNKVVWQNKDNTIHTATSGTGASDPNSGKIFDTKFITAGSSSSPQELKGVKVGDVVQYYCQIHPYMTAKFTITAAASKGSSGSGASAGGASSTTTTATTTTTAAASGPTLSIPAGASTQGNPSYDPNPMTVKKGDTIQVQNKDQTPHTVTSGKGLDDPAKGKLFDTSIIAPGASAKVTTASLNSGQYPFHCEVHPYMTGTLKVQ